MAAAWTEIGQVQTSASAEGFYSAIAVLVNKPHVINRRLCGAKILSQWHVHVDCEVFLRDILTLDAAEDREGILSTVSEACQRCTTTSSDAVSCAVEITLRELLPKEMHRFPLLTEVVLIDPERCTATFVPVRVTGGGQTGPRESCLPTAYRLQLNPGERRLSVSLLTESAQDKSQGLGCSPEWLRTTLLPKLAQWGEEPKLNTEVTSLKLVPIDKYNDKYQDMKVRYGRHLVETWPEATDPRKFVYEDIAIAAYLLVLWEEEQRERGMKMQSFVDLGCGNGLLVHLLNSEGYPGVGIDVRQRKIWDTYGPGTNLQERTITPSDSHLFPDYDWILGNHSDELTPWIPVIAARSSYECSYFVLPCCHWDFAGKFCLKEAGTSQYRTYLEFVRSVGETCGFRVREDTLRIPSTKRVCFVGSQRTYTKESQVEKCSQIQAYIDSRCQKTASHLCKSDSKGTKHGDLPTIPCMTPADPDMGERQREVGKEQNWAEDFRVRSVVETSRNCVDVDKGVIDRIVKRVFDELLADPAAESKTLADGCLWNAGGRIPLADIAAWFDGSTLLHLKSECGGLQTLLRNKHQIFQVSGGCVQLRDWTRVSEHDRHQMAKKKRKGNRTSSGNPTRVTKTQLCYFQVHHPSGCLLPAELCRFAHGTDELRPGTSDLRPHINNHQPGTDEGQASTDELRPDTNELRPHINHHRPGANECQASTDELRPGTHESPPDPIDFKPTPSYADR